jgi:hypothetical protein
MAILDLALAWGSALEGGGVLMLTPKLATMATKISPLRLLYGPLAHLRGQAPGPKSNLVLGVLRHKNPSSRKRLCYFSFQGLVQGGGPRVETQITKGNISVASLGVSIKTPPLELTPRPESRRGVAYDSNRTITDVCDLCEGHLHTRKLW